MEAYILDTNGFLIDKKDINLEEQETLDYTTVHMTIGYYKPRFNQSIQDWEEGATLEEIEQIEQEQEANRPPQEPNEMEVLEGKVMALEESQTGQDCIIDDLIFEVIPMLEQQINVNNTQPIQVASVISNKLIKGESAMAAYLAKKIMDGRDYQAVFKTYSYKMYQDEVDTILELEGRGDLIKR